MTRRDGETKSDSGQIEGGPGQVTRRLFLRGMQAVAVAVPAVAVLSSCDHTDDDPKDAAVYDTAAVDSAIDTTAPDQGKKDAGVDAAKADSKVDSMIDTTLQVDSEPDM